MAEVDTSTKKFNPAYKIYKPNKGDHNKGSVTSWEWNPNSHSFFVTFAKQKENGGEFNTFDWDNSQTMKLEYIDIAEILLVLEGHKTFVGPFDSTSNKGKGLFHQVKGKGNAILKLYNINGQLAIELSTKKNDQLFWSGQRISESEGVILSIILKRITWEIYNS